MFRLYRPSVIRMIVLLSGVYLVYYLWWRTTATLNFGALAFSLIVLAAEAQGAINFFLFGFMTWDLKHLPRSQPEAGLQVDIYVPTYDEPVDIVETTLIGCRAISYPHTTYVLDDGRRREVAAMAARLGCQYLTRPDNRHAKAGNLNAALGRTEGEFIAILDADTVPQPDFLEKTLGYFRDDRVALVQLPQEFYNLDSVQHIIDRDGPEPWHEQALFYRVIQPGKNRWNAAFWCGSPSIVRRAALESVGGVAEESVTEDLQTSLRLHAKGWKTVFHPETLAYGIAPQSMHAFAVQRLRWAQGTMQILRSRENPIVMPGLTLAQRLNYVASMFTYFDAFQKLIYLLTPAVIILTGVLPLQVGGQSFVAHWLPYFLLSMLANIASGRGTFHYLRVEKYNLLKMFTFIWASTLIIWPRGLRFRVTPKEADQTVHRHERRHLTPHVAVISFLTIAVVIGTLNLLWGFTAIDGNSNILLMTVFWALVNMGLLAIGTLAVLRRLHNRRRYRFPSRLGVVVTDLNGMMTTGTTEDLSLEGAALVLATDHLKSKSHVTVVLCLPDQPITVQAEILHRRALSNGHHRVGIRFQTLDPEERSRLIEYLYVTLPRNGATALPAYRPEIAQPTAIPAASSAAAAVPAEWSMAN